MAVLTTMKLLILTCLVAVALARPNEPDSIEVSPIQFRQENIDELKDHIMEDTEQKDILKEDMPSQRYLEAIRDQKLIPRVKLSSHPYLGEPVKVVTQPFPQFFQLGASPYVAWYYPPQVMQYIAHPSSYDTPEGIASEDGGKTDVMPQWWW
nr:alpha-S1-casein-like [Camelus dromedarius]